MNEAAPPVPPAPMPLERRIRRSALGLAVWLLVAAGVVASLGVLRRAVAWALAP